MRAVIFIESNTSGTGEIYFKKVIHYGLKPILLTLNSNLYSFLKNWKQIDVVNINTLDEENIINFCKRYIAQGNSIEGVTSTSEYYIQMASKIAQYLKLLGAHYTAIRNCRNKYMQYKILKENGFNIPQTNVIEDQEQISDKLLDMEFPVVIKPIEGSGSVGVRLCGNYSECFDLITHMLSKNENERGIKVDNRVLIEQFILGEEYSGEVFDGKLIGITKKHLGELPFFVETGHDFPALLENQLYKKIKKTITEAVMTLNLSWGPCHVEFKILDDKIIFIEVNPRLAGGFIPEIVKMSTGIDLIDIHLRKILRLPINLNKIKNNSVGIRFLIPEKEGYITSFQNRIKKHGILEVKEYKTAGTLFRKYGDFRDRIGHVIFDMNIVSSLEVEKIIKVISEGLTE